MKHAFRDLIRVWPLYLLPQHTLSRVIYHLTRLEFPPWKNFLINVFIRIFDVQMSDSKNNDAADFRSFNDFFTRALKRETRPFESNPELIISPVDGFLSEFGVIEDQTLVQAKGRNFSLNGLLAGNQELVAKFNHGSYATLYLSPGDYHRIHMPCTGQLSQMIYVPGRLFPVNGPSTRVVDRLFSRNERAITVYSTDTGNMALILVGAIFVGSMETVWAGEINSPYPTDIQTDLYEHLAKPVVLEKGGEMGRFNMGSTVIVLFQKGTVTWEESLTRGQQIRMGQRIGRKQKSVVSSQ